MVKALKKNINMTEGPLLGKIIIFVLPLMASNLLQVLYNSADMMVVSLSHEPDAVGAIGTTGSLINLIVNLFIGFATGTNVILGQNLGAKDDRQASKTVHTSLVLSVVLGLLASVVGILFSGPILRLMGAEDKLLDLAITYTQIYFIGVPFASVTNYAVAIFRAKGDTKTPLYVLAVSGVINVLLNLFFVMVCGLSVEGVAIATAVANMLSAAVLLFILSRDEGPCRFSFRGLGIDNKAILRILKIGLPAAIQGALFSISNMIIQSSIIRVNNTVVPPGAEYQPIVKANSATANLDGFIYTATNAVYQASITFTSQNVGAGKYDRVKRVLVCSLIVTTVVAIVFSGIIILLNQPLLSLYGVVDGAEGTLEHIAYQTAIIRLMYCTVPYFTLAWMEVGCGCVRGLGRSISSTIISLLGSCVLRVVWIYTIFEHFLTLESIYISYPISWLLTGLVQILFALYITGRELKNKKSQAIT